jgi:hypothetical protein
MPSPATLLGLPPGIPDPFWQVAALRDTLVLLGLVWAWLCVRARSAIALALGLLVALLATGFFVLALGRPVGVLQEPAATRRAAEIAVTAELGRPSSLLARHAGGPAWPWRELLALGAPARALQLLPSLLPAIVVPLIGFAVFAFWRRREQALLAACLALGFGTGALETVRGAGLLARAWSRPEATLALSLVAVAVLALGRIRGRAGVVLASVSGVAWAAVRPAAAAPGPLDALLLVTLDQLPWSLLGVLGWRQAAVPARVLIVSGAGFCLATSLGLPFDGWGASSLLRLGLLLASVGPLADLAERLRGEGWPPLLRTVAAPRVAAALTLAALLPGSFLLWWDPVRADPGMGLSAEPISANLSSLAAWIRSETPRDAVFLASADYAPYVAVLAGRRVLRAPSLLLTADDTKRQRAEGAILAGRQPPPAISDFGVGFVLIAPGDFKARGIRGPEDLAGRPRLRLRHVDPHGFRVYEIVRE